LTTDFCLNAVLETLNHYGTPAIFNTDLDDQFTALKFTGLLKDDGVQISVDGQGCWRDNVFVEQIWNSIKYEEVYPHTYECGNDVGEGLDIYHTFYNQRRSHTALDDNTPDTVSFKNLPVRSHTPQANNRRAALMKTEPLSK
jgi:putative transposase